MEACIYHADAVSSPAIADENVVMVRKMLCGRAGRKVLAEVITDAADGQHVCCPAAGYARYLMSCAYRRAFQ